MTRRQRRLLMVAALIVAAVAMGPGLYRRYLVHYHRHRMRLAMEQQLADAPAVDKLPIVRWFFPPRPPFVSETMWEIDQAEKHRAALVDLGELETERFVLKYLKHSTLEARHLNAVLGKLAYEHRAYGEGNWSNEPIPIEWTLWTERGEMEMWRRFFARYDVPNYWEIRDQSVQLPEPVRQEL